MLSDFDPNKSELDNYACNGETYKLREVAARCLAARKKIKYLKTAYNRQFEQLKQNFKSDIDNLTIELERIELDAVNHVYYQRHEDSDD